MARDYDERPDYENTAKGARLIEEGGGSLRPKTAAQIAQTRAIADYLGGSTTDTYGNIVLNGKEWSVLGTDGGEGISDFLKPALDKFRQSGNVVEYDVPGIGRVLLNDGTAQQEFHALANANSSSIFDYAPYLVAGALGAIGPLGLAGGGLGSAAEGLGGALASEAGFVPGALELGASGYGGTAAAGLDAAAAAAGGSGGGGLTGLLNTPTPPTSLISGGGGSAPAGGGSNLPFGSSVGDYLSASSGLPVEMPTGAGAATDPSFLSGAGGVGNYLAASAAGAGGLTSAAGTALSRILEGTASNADWASVLGTGLQTGLGIFSGMQQSDAVKDIADKSRADRLPALNAFNNALLNPDTFYSSAPAMGATDAVLRKLSMTGNPALDPGSLSKAAAYNLGGYNDYLRGLSGPAFGTASNEANINLAGAQSQGNAWEAAGAGLESLLNPRRNYTLSLNDLMAGLA